MSKQALLDAFMAGWDARQKYALHGDDANKCFEIWYREACERGSREPDINWISLDFAEVEKRFMTQETFKKEYLQEYPPVEPTTNRELLKREIGKRATMMLLDDAPKKHTVRYFGEPGGAGGVEYRFLKRSKSPFDQAMSVEDRPPPPYTSENEPKRHKRRKGKK